MKVSGREGSKWTDGDGEALALSSHGLCKLAGSHPKSSAGGGAFAIKT